MMTTAEIQGLVKDLEAMRDDGETAFDVIVRRAIERLNEHTKGSAARHERRRRAATSSSPKFRRTADLAALLAAEHFGVEATLVLRRCRLRTVARARQVAMAALHTAGRSVSLAQIAAHFDRNHSTVLHAIRQTEADEELRTARELVRLRMSDHEEETKAKGSD